MLCGAGGQGEARIIHSQEVAMISLCFSCDPDVSVFLQYDRRQGWLWYHLGQWFATTYVSDRHWSSPIILDNRCSTQVRPLETSICLLTARLAHFLLGCTVASPSYDA
jgi:hypothetical protein